MNIWKIVCFEAVIVIAAFSLVWAQAEKAPVPGHEAGTNRRRNSFHFGR